MIECSDIVGQDEAVARIQRAMSQSRMPHAYLFAGPDGVGRRTTAIALARTLLCPQPVSVAAGRSFRQACGKCPDCRMVEAGSHPDFHPVYKELAAYHDDSEVRDRVMQSLSIGVIQQFLIDAVGRSSTRGRGKVFVVEEAELMTHEAQNALLKTLEEPPPGVTIILICEKPEELLPTTLSRCSLVRFSLLPREFVAGKLAEAGVAADEARFWAAFTQGSVGRAMALSGAGMYEVKREVLSRLAGLPPAGDVELGEQLAERSDKLAETAVAASRKAEGPTLAKTLASRQSAGTMLELIASAYRDALALRTGAELEIIHADQRRQLDSLATRFTPEQLAGIIESLSECERLLWRNVNPRIVWDNAVLACASGTALRV
ncbi:MAG TPA: hypothetical protein DCX07_11550 [Phycisphaerales bacterium]|nr:hypothetical protein [Phycisphaerales bacterium]